MKSNLVTKLLTYVGIGSSILLNNACTKSIDEFNTASGKNVKIYSLNDELSDFKVTEVDGNVDTYTADSKLNILKLNFNVSGEPDLDEEYFKNNDFARKRYQLDLDRLISQYDSVQQVRLENKD